MIQPIPAQPLEALSYDELIGCPIPGCELCDMLASFSEDEPSILPADQPRILSDVEIRAFGRSNLSYDAAYAEPYEAHLPSAFDVVNVVGLCVSMGVLESCAVLLRGGKAAIRAYKRACDKADERVTLFGACMVGVSLGASFGAVWFVSLMGGAR